MPTNDSALIDASYYVRPEGVRDRTSAGGIVVRRDENGCVLLAIVREADFASYVLPKGGVDDGENYEQAARREIHEEAGFTDLTLRADLGSRSRLSHNRKFWLTTHYFLFETTEITVFPIDPAHPQPPVWIDLHEVDDAPFLWPEQRDLVLSERDRILQIIGDATRAF